MQAMARSKLSLVLVYKYPFAGDEIERTGVNITRSIGPVPVRGRAGAFKQTTQKSHRIFDMIVS
jgi:hypothetical protein